MAKKFLVEYRHVEESYYHEWIEAETEEEAKKKAEDGEVDFEDYVNGCGLYIDNVSIIGGGVEQ